MSMQKEIALIQDLAKRYSEIAFQDENRERRERCRKVNDLIPQRPPVWIDEIPWNEMDIEGKLKLQCTDPFLQEMETFFRRNLYRYEYIKADTVFPEYYPIEKSYTSSGIGISITEETIATDQENNIVSHHYIDQLDTEEKLEKLHNPVITPHPEQDAENQAKASEILKDILPVKLKGTTIYHAPWDDISMLRGVEPIFFDMMDRPEFIHQTIQKFMEMALSKMEQLEKYNLLDPEPNALHCTPPYSNDLPKQSDPSEPTPLKNVWFRAMAQMFSTISPAMFDEFELEYEVPLAKKCGLTYYGCCEPLDNFIPLLKKRIPNLRKLGVSPWADITKCAQEIGSDYVYARKPNPAMVAGFLDPDAIRKEISDTIKVCLEYNCPYEFVLKDISTVGHNPKNLILWNQIVQETIDEYYK